MTAIVLSVLLVPISLIAMRYRARCNELQRAAVADAVHRADYANRRDREVAQLQRTIATLVRERDDVIARSVGNDVMRSRGKAGQQ